MIMKKGKIWFITGASKGLGLTLVKLLLTNGDKVAATSRNAADIERQIDNNENLLPLTIDITSDDSVKEALNQTVEKFGGVDVIVNNAGYSLYGSVESLTDQEFRQSMDVNFFGTVNVVRNAMPFLRKQKSGHIINFSSAGGYKGYANSPSYAAAKFAVIGLSESLAEEAKPFGINVTAVAPGFFRTDFLNKGDSLMCENPIPEYNAQALVDILQSMNGKQPGDPAKLAQTLIDITEVAEPPVHLLMGPDAYRIVADKRKQEQEEIEAWKEVTCSTNLDGDDQSNSHLF